MKYFVFCVFETIVFTLFYARIATMQELYGPNVGIFALGRIILKKNPKAEIRFCKCAWSEVRDEKDGITGADLWEAGLQYCTEKTRFGRIGVFMDRKNVKALEVFGNEVERLRGEKIERVDKRAETELKINLFETQVLYEMSLEGYGESVEFRRLARKCIRDAKHANCDVIYFPEANFGEESTQKTLQQIAGTQIQVVTLADVFGEEVDGWKGREMESKKRVIEISDDFSDFEKQRAAEILKTKLKI